MALLLIGRILGGGFIPGTTLIDTGFFEYFSSPIRILLKNLEPDSNEHAEDIRPLVGISEIAGDVLRLQRDTCDLGVGVVHEGGDGDNGIITHSGFAFSFLKKGGCKLLRIEVTEVVDPLPDPDQGDGYVELVAKGKENTTLGGTIQFCHHETTEGDCLLEGLNLADGVLAGGGIQNQQGFMR